MNSIIEPQPIGEINHGVSANVLTNSQKNFFIVEKEEDQKMIPNVVPNTESMKDTNGERFREDGDNVIFPKIGFVFHKSFADRFRNMTFIQARRNMKNWFTHGQKDEIVHYLKAKRIVKN